MLVLVAALLAVQPVGRPALAEEPAPALFTIAGVVAATLRAEPDGASPAVAIVPAGSVLTRTGPDVVLAGVAWRPVRTAEGQVGYLPAGLLAPLGGAATTEAPPAPVVEPGPGSGAMPSSGPATTSGAVPAQSVGATRPQPVGGTPDPPASSTPIAPTGVPDGGSATSPPAPQQPDPTRAGAGQAGPVAAAQPQPTPTMTPTSPTASGPTGGAGRIVVRFRPGATPQGREAAHRAAGTNLTRTTSITGMTVVEVAPGAVRQALAAYRGRSDVAWAEQDRVVRASLTPNDPLLGQQWGPLKIGVPIAWDVTQGSTTTYVAILDSGIFSATSPNVASDGLHGHPDLRGKVALERGFTGVPTDWDDRYGHGTLMAGIAGASVNTAIPTGMAGIGFNARLYNGKVLDDTGSGYESWVADGIMWAANNGAQVISMSLGAPGPCTPVLQDAIDHAWSMNVVVVAAAGNDSVLGSEYPGNCAHVISVAAINADDSLASFSNYGPSIPLTAPGVNIMSSTRFGGHDYVSGTSPAAPHVAGVAALLKSTPYGASNQGIVNRLFQTADPIVGTGSLWAYGRVNAAAAVGPVACAPRPKVTIQSTPGGGVLNVVATVAGVGNAIRVVETGPAAGPQINALVSFPTASSQSGGTTTYVPLTVGKTATFQVDRKTAGLPTTVPFIVTDGCGTWKSLAGGGPGSGF